MTIEHDSPAAERIGAFVREGFTPDYGRVETAAFDSRPLWAKVKALRTKPWLDSGDAKAVAKVWSREFTALTTNNTLLNKEVRKGAYDGFIAEAHKLLKDMPELSDHDRALELAFMLNARHALTLVQEFDAFVSVEEHTDLAHDVDGSVRYARRFHAVCPERFIVKIPFSAAGLLAARKAAGEGIPINQTLGFSARQNYVSAAVARPAFVNVFLGRLNSFVADNGLGNGDYVGERAALASQTVVRALREEAGVGTEQIAASLRSAPQVRDLAGMDVITMPTDVARDFEKLGLRPEDVEDRAEAVYEPGINGDALEIGVDCLWMVDDTIRGAAAALELEDPDSMSPSDLIAFFAEQGRADFMVDWTGDQIEASREEGKIPELAKWSSLLESGRIGLDSLMNLAGLNSFAADQAAMDRHVREVTGSGS